MNSKVFLLFSLFIFMSISIFPQDIKVIESNSNFIVISYTLSVNQKFQKSGEMEVSDISLPNGVFKLNQSKSFPSRLVNIGVPNENGNSIQILQSTSSEYSILDKFEKLSGMNEESKLVEFDEYGLIRSLDVYSIRISPFQYDLKNGKIKIFTKIIFKVNYSSDHSNKEKITDKFLQKAVLNFDVASNWGVVKNKLNKIQTNSVLSEGTWYRFDIQEEGIYKITKSQLNQLGINANNVGPKTIKIFNNGVINLDTNIDNNYPVGLIENSIYVSGEEDGKFDDNDYILFYGQGSNSWEFDSKVSNIVRKKNIYSKKNYYFITSGGQTGKRMSVQNSISSSDPYKQFTSKAFYFLDEDKVNVGKSGRDYYGDELNNSVRSKTYMPNLQSIAKPGLKYKFRFANASSPNISLNITESGTTLVNQTLFGYGKAEYIWGKEFNITANYSGMPANNTSQIKFNITPASSEGKLLLDYFEIFYERELRAYEDYLMFFSKDTNTVIEYNLSNFSNSDISVFNVTDFANVKIIGSPFISGGDFRFIASETTANPSKFVASTSTKFKTISGVEKVENQNIQGISDGAEYILVTSKKFKTEAERLQQYRQNDSPNSMSVKIVFIEDIYNEFSCGRLDPVALRNFLKYSFDNWATKPYYVLLFGDGTYDFLNSEGYNTNYIPTFQTAKSLEELYSFPFDDFFSRISENDQKPDIAIGRIPILNSSDANNYIDKIIKYENDNDGSLWRTRVTLIADDGLTSKGDDGNTHTKQAEELAAKKIPVFMDKNKIYLSAYPTVISGFGRRKPLVNVALIDAVNNGTLLLNYTGHGNPDVWAHENIFERYSTIPQFKNEKLFFLTAATCDFGKYDDPNIISGTEEMLLLKNYGMIGGFSASRLVFSDQNAAINEMFYSKLFRAGTQVTFGEAFLLTKQERTGDNDEKFHLFCDPAIKIKLPKLSVVIDKINNLPATSDIQIKALSEVKIEGFVRDENLNYYSTYSGEGILTVFDSEKSKFLEDIKYSMNEQGGVIFRGRVSVHEGKFAVSFRVPKDISYENKNGKIIAYTFNEDMDAIGSSNKIVVGGTDSSIVNDNRGPDVEIFFDDISNQNGSVVNQNFALLVKLTDETGLNTSGTGVGHKLEGVLDDNENSPVDFSNHFIGDLDSGGKSGLIHYNFTNISVGLHKIKIKAWDIFNNPTLTEINFEVVNTNSLVIKDVYNYPNPFSKHTTFSFQHNFSEPIDIKIKIYTISGRMIKELNEFNILDRFVKIPWDGKDDDGDIIANGTYLYKLIIKNDQKKINSSYLGKLAVLR
ncbi:MAG: hypothetical protein CO129_09540 [Ignavibacteriales bacterium CG_4_9_14_3_um_filter_34_10]|nr:MAG: hypothetical protein CO129_09540 [Ignavibacteriales bacterium CG_4_9_14_3_um_filter_34_10]